MSLSQRGYDCYCLPTINGTGNREKNILKNQCHACVMKVLAWKTPWPLADSNASPFSKNIITFENFIYQWFFNPIFNFHWSFLSHFLQENHTPATKTKLTLKKNSCITPWKKWFSCFLRTVRSNWAFWVFNLKFKAKFSFMQRF